MSVRIDFERTAALAKDIQDRNMALAARLRFKRRKDPDALAAAGLELLVAEAAHVQAMILRLDPSSRNKIELAVEAVVAMLDHQPEPSTPEADPTAATTPGVKPPLD